MSAALPTPAVATRRLALSVAGMVLTRWTSVSISRNLRDIAGSFTLQIRESGREALLFNPDLDPLPRFAPVLAGQTCSIALDGQKILIGWIDEVNVDWSEQGLTCTVTGRDVAGDLVDCAAAPNGPVEYRNLNTQQIAQRIAAPFAISVSADVDVGATFPVFGIEADELALSAIEKAARQQALLVTSNGVGTLLLTRGGTTRAPGPLTRPGNIQGGSSKVSFAQRFSDYYVKGQTNRSLIRKTQQPLLMDATDPRDGITFPIETSTTATATESTASIMTGHANDPQVTRYRPTVRTVKTQAGAATVQSQADWGLRIALGMGSTLNYKVLDWRADAKGRPAGPSGGLWLPNALTHVKDPLALLDKDMLISGVTYGYDETGAFTRIELAGPTAFDRIDEAADDPRYIVGRKPKSFGPTRNG